MKTILSNQELVVFIVVALIALIFCIVEDVFSDDKVYFDYPNYDAQYLNEVLHQENLQKISMFDDLYFDDDIDLTPLYL